MNWAWATSLDQLWRSPAFPMWLTLAAAGFFGLLVLVTLMRAEKSVATGALTVITLLAVGIAVASTLRSYGPGARGGTAGDDESASTSPAALPALSCLDDLAGEVVLAACEKAVFATPESAAAAVAYAGSQVSRLAALGDVTTATPRMTPEMQALRRAIERDRYGLVAQVLQTRDQCTPIQCAVFRSLTDNHQIITNMDEHTYDELVTRYAAAWNAPPPPVAAAGALGALAALPPSVPTGRPTNADFPSAASTPAVSIMAPEPGTATRSASSPANAGAATVRPAPAAAKKPPPKPVHAPASVGPTLLSPGTAAPAAASN